MPQQRRDWAEIAKEATIRFIRRPFANSLSLITASGGLLLMFGQTILDNVFNVITMHFFDIKIPSNPPGPWEYGVGTTLVLGALIYSAFFHYLSMSAKHKADDEIPHLQVYFLSNDDSEIGTTPIANTVFSISDPENIPDCTPRFFYETLINREYWRELYSYYRGIGICVPLRIRIKNIGLVSGRSIVARVEVTSSGLIDDLIEHLPSPPQNKILIPSKHYWHTEGVDLDGNTATINIPILNPGDHYTTKEDIFFQPLSSGAITLTARVYSEDMPEPLLVTKTVPVHVDEIDLDAREAMLRMRQQEEHLLT